MKRGLVLCGGGSKGAYQMGAWIALEELGEKFDIVTGTSIGCLNGAMYTQGEFERCDDLWNKIKIEMIMNGSLTLDGLNVKKALKEQNDLMTFLKKYVKYRGSDITPFYGLLDEYIDVDKIQNSKIEFGIVTCTFPSFKPVEIVAREAKKSELRKYILASTSCFPIFPVCKINNQGYVDGGYYDNLPINFALNLGATDIVAIDLNYGITHPEYINKPYIRYIKPSWNLGGFMMFEEGLKKMNKTLGYNDTMKSYGKYLGFRYTFFNKLDYEEEARNFVLELTRFVSQMRIMKIKTVIRPESDGDLFSVLEKHTIRPLTDYEYFLRAIENTSELLAIDHLAVYEVKDLIEKIVSTLFHLETLETDLFNGYLRIKASSKQKEFIIRLDDNKLIKYLSDLIIDNEEENKDLMFLIAACKPKIFLVYALLKALKNKIVING